MAIETSIVVKDSGTAVVKAHAKATDVAMEGIEEAVEGAASAFSEFTSKSDKAFKDVSKDIKGSASDFKSFANQTDASLSKAESQFKDLEDITDKFGSQVDDALNKAEESLRDFKNTGALVSGQVENALETLQNEFIVTGSKAEQSSQRTRSAFKRMADQVSSAVSSAINGLKRLNDSFARNVDALSRFSSRIRGAVRGIFNLRNAILGIGLGLLVKNTVQTAQSMESLELAFRAAAGGAAEGAAELAFIREQSERLGLELVGTASSYKGLLAATEAAGKSTEDARLIFLGIAEAGRAMSLSNEEMKGTLLAVTQIMSKGKVTAEELRLQLGERFPIAVGVMAQALDVTTKELSKMLDQGEITADALIPFAEKLREKYGKDVVEAAQKSGAAINRLKNSFTELQTAIGKGGLLQAVTIVANALRDMFDEILKTDAPRKIGEQFIRLGRNISGFIKNEGPKMVKVFENLVTFINDNAGPAFFALKQTVLQSFAAINVSVASATKLLTNIVGTVLQAQLSVNKLQRAFTFGNARKEMDEGIKKLEDLIDSTIEMGLSADKTNDKYQMMLDDLVNALDAPKKKTEEFARDSVKSYATITTASGKVFSTINDGSESSAKSLNRITRANGEVLTTLDEVTQSVEKGDKASRKAWSFSIEKIPSVTDKLREAKKEAQGLKDAYEEIGEKSIDELKKAAEESVKAFGKIIDKGDETKERLITLFTPVAKQILDTFGKVPPGMEEIFSKMRQKTGVNFAKLNEQAEQSAKAVSSQFEFVGRDIGRAIQGGVEVGLDALSELARKMAQTKASFDAFQDAFRGQAIPLADTLQGLQEQLNEAMTRGQRLILHASDLSLDSFIAIQEQNQAFIRLIQERMDELRRGGSLSDNLGSGSIGGSINTPITEVPPVMTTPPTITRPLGVFAGESDFGGVLQDPSVGGSGSGSGGVSRPETIVIGSDNTFTSDEEKRIDDIIEGGFAGERIDEELLVGRRGSGTGSTTITMENPSFSVINQGVSADAINADEIAMQLAPAIMEMSRRGQLDTTPQTSVETS